jgi:general secretion pathway protein I
LEVLVALAILAGALAVMFQIFSRTLDTTADASQRTIAAGFAQSLLARVGSEIPLAPGKADGRFDSDFTWHLQISSYGEDQYKDWPFVRPYEVAVEVSWSERASRHSLKLETLRLARRGDGR